MSNIGGHSARACLAAVCCLVAGFGDAVAGQPQGKQLSPAEQKEYEQVRERLRNYEGLLTGASWTLCHCADQKEIKRVEKTLNLVGAFVDSDQLPELVEAGGVKAFKDDVADLLKNKDPVVRGFGALLLAAIGDTGYKRDIARLLEDKGGPPPTDWSRLFYNFDRSRAAMALGLMGAKEYAPRLAALLRSSDESDRTGAALGLGYMGAKEYVKDIAKLLSDDEDRVQTAATAALAGLDATEYAKDIAGLLTSLGDPMVNETACYALARLNAKEQAPQLAALLNDRFRKGDAAKALALLGAKQYTEAIAALMEDSEPLVRCDALTALGILDAKPYVKKMAAHLKDEETFVRAYAATALLMMGDETNAKQVLEVVRAEWALPEIASDGVDPRAYFSVHIDLHPLAAERHHQLTTRAVETWERLNRVER